MAGMQALPHRGRLAASPVPRRCQSPTIGLELNVLVLTWSLMEGPSRIRQWSGNKMRWIVIVSMAAALATCGRAAVTDAQCSENLPRALDAKNPETRKQAVVALSLASERGPWFDQLDQMLQDKDVEVRQAVVASLADVKSESATAALRKALEDPVPEVSFAAAKALWVRQDRVGRDALLSVLEGESKTLIQFLLQAETRRPAHDAHAADHVPVCREAGCWFRSAAGAGRRDRVHAGDPRELGSLGTRHGGVTAGRRQGSRHYRRT